MADPVYVTSTRLPQFETFCGHLKKIFASGWMTNGGAYVRQLEQELSDYLGCPYLLVCNNGTTALMLALHCAGLRRKKVAVTAYTYVATLSALLWNDCTPVFVDIDPKTLSMSPQSLAQAFEDYPDIAGVLPVHIYGLPCDDEALGALCRKKKAVLIYDAAHAFGSSLNGRSLLDFGDLSVCSFHATKLFHTVEGGCIVAHSKKDFEALALARAFGHRGDTHYTLGINAKMSELHAAVGLCILPETKEEIAKRKKLHELYDKALADIPLFHPLPPPGLEWNYAYYPILLPNETKLQCVIEALAHQDIHPRRYFYPALTTLPYVRHWSRACPVAEDVATRILCLPLYGELQREKINTVSALIHNGLKR